MRYNHVIAGMILFGTGLFLALYNILYVVEFIKGGLQPVFLMIGLAAAGAAVFHPHKTNRKVNIGVAILFLFVGGYGVYDEYFATMDFLSGILPLLMLVGGFLSLLHGISRLKQP